ncbi:RNA pyrophosphohydrolase [Bacilli bacterium]|nr:RNA pyrophosphohydrolase [Bacilli bacterium]
MNLRKAIGAVILDNNNNIVVFQRSDFPENWQCPEGGIDEDETPEEALARELQEEIGLTPEKFVILGKTKNFIPYLFKDGKSKYGFDGQEKQFFLVKLTGQPVEFKYDNNIEEIEFLGHKTIQVNKLIDLIPDFKKDLYREVLMEFGLLL